MDLSFLSEVQRPLAEGIIQQCAMSRLWFVENVLKVKHIEDWQRETLKELDEGGTKLSIRSGHGVGKTALCSWCALHFLLFRNDVKVIVTSPSAKQMSDGLIPEIQKWVNRLPGWMAMQLEITSERLTRKPDNKNNFISFRTARKENPEALQGVHAESVMIIVDEASGVDEVIYEAGQGSLSTPGSVIILIGNPTRPSGFFYKTHNELSDLWWTRKVSCQNSSRVSDDYIAGQLRTYGPDSREYRVRVLGDFPESGEYAVVPRSYVESAQGREIDIDRYNTVWGVDPGRGGDPSAFIERSDNAVLSMAEYRLDDTMKLTGIIKGRWDQTPTRLRPEMIFVDAVGLGGGVADRLAEQGLPVLAVNVSELPSESTRYMQLRDELWYAARHWFERKDVWLPTRQEQPLVEKFTHELCSVEAEYLSSGKLKVESKEAMKRKGNPSPNLADAFNLTFAGGGAISSGLHGDTWAKTEIKNSAVPGLV